MISDKIRWIIETVEGGNKSKFARNIGIKGGLTGLVDKWLSGKAKPKTEYRKAICTAYGQPEGWLDDDDPNSKYIKEGATIRFYLLFRDYAKSTDSFYAAELKARGMDGGAIKAFRSGDPDAIETYQGEIGYLIKYMDISAEDVDRWKSTLAPWKGATIKDRDGNIVDRFVVDNTVRVPRPGEDKNGTVTADNHNKHKWNGENVETENNSKKGVADKNIGKRIGRIVDEIYDKNIKGFASNVGVTVKAVEGWVAGKSKPNNAECKEICRAAYGIDREWLDGYNVPMFVRRLMDDSGRAEEAAEREVDEDEPVYGNKPPSETAQILSVVKDIQSQVACIASKVNIHSEEISELKRERGMGDAIKGSDTDQPKEKAS